MRASIVCATALSLCIAAPLMGEEIGRFARISEIEGEVQLWREGAPDWEYGALNMLIEEGDLLETGAHDYAEVELDNGTAIRLDEGTRIKILELSRDYGEHEWVSAIDLDYGSVDVWTPDYDEWQSYLDVETPAGLVTVDEDSEVRVNVTERSDRTEILVYSGVADVIGKENYVTLYAHEKTRIGADGEPFDPWRFDVDGADRFDRWCQSLQEERVKVVEHRYVDTSIHVGVSDLDSYGTWVFVADYGYCWRPRLVTQDWRPYRDGRWVWSARWGWTWIPCEPWGWVPYHYGRWVWASGCGWVWVPGRVFGPGWVSWYYGPGWIAWVPLDPFDYPCCWRMGLQFNVWTCVGTDDFYAPRYRWKPYPTGEPHKPYRAYKVYRDDVRVEERQFERKPPRDPGTIVRAKTVTRRESGVRDELKRQARTSRTDAISGKAVRPEESGQRTNPSADRKKLEEPGQSGRESRSPEPRLREETGRESRREESSETRERSRLVRESSNRASEAAEQRTQAVERSASRERSSDENPRPRARPQEPSAEETRPQVRTRSETTSPERSRAPNETAPARPTRERVERARTRIDRPNTPAAQAPKRAEGPKAEPKKQSAGVERSGPQEQEPQAKAEQSRTQGSQRRAEPKRSTSRPAGGSTRSRRP
jgi:hypothetical protein